MMPTTSLLRMIDTPSHCHGFRLLFDLLHQDKGMSLKSHRFRHSNQLDFHYAIS